MKLTLEDLIKEAGECSKEKGFFDLPLNVGEQLMLIVSEAAEAMEDVRKGPMDLVFVDYDGTLESRQITDAELAAVRPGIHKDALFRKPCGFPSELADIVIRVATLSARMGIDLERAIQEKLRYNRTRPHLHGGKTV